MNTETSEVLVTAAYLLSTAIQERRTTFAIGYADLVAESMPEVSAMLAQPAIQDRVAALVAIFVQLSPDSLDSLYAASRGEDCLWVN